jgi:type I restriction-modification system DNA methylase subunit
LLNKPKKRREFFTPKEVVRLLVELVESKEGMSICDPTCGSGSMLIESRKYVECSGRNPGITRHGIPKDVKMMALFTTVEEKAVVTTKVD